MTYILLLVISINILLGLLIIYQNKKSWNNRLFSLLSFLAAGWTFTNLMTGISPTPFWLESTYAVGSLVIAAGLIWIFNFVDGPIDKKKVIIVGIFALYFFLASYWKGFLVKTYQEIYLGGTFVGEAGFGLILYTIYFLICAILIIYKLIHGYKNADKSIIKIQIRYTLFGALATITISLFTSFAVPLFSLFKFGGLDSIGFLIFLAFIAYSVTKHHLFSIKVIATEILTALMAIMLLMKIPFSESMSELAFNLIFFHIFLVLGIFLIRTVWLEIHRVQEIEKLNQQKLAAYDTIKAQADELKLANIELKKLLDMKTEFLRVASHQLRTPTSIVKGMLSMLIEGSVPPEKREGYIRMTFEASEKLSNIIRDILLATSIETGRLELKFEPVQLAAMIDKAIQERKNSIEKKQLNLKVDIPKDLPLITGDKYTLEQVINNILDNAIFYTHKGEINIEVKNNSGDITLNVKDTGVGINPEDKKRLFKVFTRGEHAQQVHPDGSGLGLYIAKNIIDFHRGAINIFSDGQGQGTEVTVTLPKR